MANMSIFAIAGLGTPSAKAENADSDRRAWDGAVLMR